MFFKGRVAAATLAMLVLTGYTEYVEADRTRTTEDLYNSISMGFTESALVLEYGEGLIDVRDFVSYADGELEVTQDTVDLSKVGTNILYYEVTKTDEFGQSATKYFPKGIKVVDSCCPQIELEKDLIEVAVGKTADLTGNILSVKDVVDGDLQLADQLQPGCYTVTHSINYKKAGTYQVTVEAMDVNGNTAEAQFSVKVKEVKKAYLIPGVDYVWKGQKLTKKRGTILGPSGKETYYNLPMSGVVKIMRRRGNNDPYWVRSDGVKMLGDYIMVAANLKTYPRGSIIQTSLGMAIVCDTGAFARKNPYQIDIAVDW